MKWILPLSIFFLSTFVLRAQYNYKVKRPAEFLNCGTGNCQADCCSNLPNLPLHDLIIEYSHESCQDDSFKSFIHENQCISIEKRYVGWFKAVRPQYFYLEGGPSFDWLFNNPSYGPFMNLMIAYYKPLTVLSDNLWLSLGVKTGVAYGYAIDSNPEFSNTEMVRLFKTEVSLSLYRKPKVHINLGFGFNPLTYRDGFRDDRTLLHLSLSGSYWINNGKRVSRVDKEN